MGGQMDMSSSLYNKIYLYDENEEILTLAKLRLAIAGVLNNLTITRRDPF